MAPFGISPWRLPPSRVSQRHGNGILAKGYLQGGRYSENQPQDMELWKILNLVCIFNSWSCNMIYKFSPIFWRHHIINTHSPGCPNGTDLQWHLCPWQMCCWYHPWPSLVDCPRSWHLTISGGLLRRPFVPFLVLEWVGHKLSFLV